jgi:hypothetical protein
MQQAHDIDPVVSDEVLDLSRVGLSEWPTRHLWHSALAGPFVRRARALLLIASASQGWLDPLANLWRTSPRNCASLASRS